MAETKKAASKPAAKTPAPDSLEVLRSEILDVLTELIDELYQRQDAGEDHYEDIKDVKAALRIFRPGATNSYS
jgi:hypothetical protein